MKLNTSAERVDWLIERSEEIYEEIDQEFDGEIRYNRMLRIGLNTLAIALKEGGSASEAGALLLSMPFDNPRISGPLDTLADEYGAVPRGTLDKAYKSETDARHAVHLMKIAPEYAALIHPELDSEKIAAYALSHDLVEARSGDVVSLKMTPEQEAKKHLDETAGLAALHAEFDDTFPELIAFIDAYESLEDAESRFTKAKDKLNPGFTHLYNSGFQLINRLHLHTEEEFLVEVAKSDARMHPYARAFPLLIEDKAELTRRVAAATYKKAA